ncbi:FkbM family methyltransferase [Bradyrhizobium sp. Ai1a-2]|uniref:FkbM family methyltransferase n=1 Tax=Bradyrhizobium sp. Ai1a-2 TaxID=196490 RepID=UPI000429259B|nr:FkbM family methyltransferase [Bradyrhizobium sp. Ai1a-2]
MIAPKSFRFFLKYALTDPSQLTDMVRRRALEQIKVAPTGIAKAHFNGVRYEIDMSLHRLMTKYFFQTHEMFLERIFRRFLSPGTTFIDIGANCGYWSAYALSLVGQTGEVHAFEPVPQYFAFVQRLAELNPDYRIFANQTACGALRGNSMMAVVAPRPENFDNYDTNIGSSSLAAGFLDHAKDLTDNISVGVIALDDYVRDRKIDLDRVSLIKIDVEGFEGAVFDGMQAVLAKDGRKVPLLCEILTDLNRSKPLDGRLIIERLEDNGYRCLDATHLRPINRRALGFEENILCV